MVDKIEQWQPAAGDRLAVVGLGVDFPACQNMKGFTEAIFNSIPVIGPVEGWQRKGCLIRAAVRAISDASWMSAGEELEIGLLAIGQAAEITGLRDTLNSSSSLFLDYAGYSEPLPAMLVQAHEWLESHEAQAVLLSGCSLSNDVLPEQLKPGFDRERQASQPGLGGIGVVLVLLKDAQRRGQKIYAVLDSLAYTHASHPAFSYATIQACAQAALQSASLAADEIGYLSATACGIDPLDAAEMHGLAQVYRGETPETALGSSQALTGYLESANGLTSLAFTAVCLANRLRPGAKGWSGPKSSDVWQGSNFYVPVEPLTWFHPGHQGKRMAAVSLVGNDGSCAHLVLSESESGANIQPVMREPGLYLFPMGAASTPGLVDRLELLKSSLQRGAPLPDLARRMYTDLRAEPVTQVAAILGHNPAEAIREVEFAIRGLPAAAEKGAEWQTPLGSYFTPAPLGPTSQVAFVYPGAFNSYLGAGRDLFNLFPGVYDALNSLAEDVGAVTCETQLYPRSLEPLTKEQLDRLEAALVADPFAMMMNGVSLSVALTHILRDTFQLRPDCAFGYSLGENSLMFAMKVWGDGLHASQRLFNSALFHTRLAGPQNAVREHWGLPDLSEGETSDDLWSNYLLMTTPERVKEALVGEPRVYLTHINTPRQVVIGGEPAGCRRVIERLKCSSLKAPFDYVLHCEAMASEYETLYHIHTLPLLHVPAVRLYSAADDRPFEMSVPGIARAVSRDLCSMLDFPKLVETAYNDGARIFIELGAGSNCAKWIEEILKGRPFLSVSANRKGVDDAASILRVLARLASHQTAVNLEPLYLQE
jgi:PfaB family protein